MRAIRVLSVLGFGLLLAACSVQWVKLTPQGENVAILQETEVANCTPNGTTTVSVLNKLIVNRDPATVQEELRRMARNSAADRGDALVATGPVVNGEQTFNIYRCRR
ncbi:MAG TPA: DUF4156 domain-containing protein [Candidatus Acidoferrum sp.]|nr:DUF4156 domain-containing protein [Candidatus Acidoferrum sp.]